MNLLETGGVTQGIKAPGHVTHDVCPPTVSIPHSDDVAIEETTIRRLAQIVAIAAFVALVLPLFFHFWIVLALVNLVRSVSNPLVSVIAGILYGLAPPIFLVIWSSRHKQRSCHLSG